MALPFRSVTAIATGDELRQEDARLALITTLSNELMAERGELEKYRNYYEGDQKLVFGAEKLKAEFGTAFADFRDNWCGTVVDAIADRLEFERIIFERETNQGQGEGAGLTDAAAKRIWDILRDNNIDEQQEDLHEAALVEGRAAAIVWPDKKLGARVDWQPAQNVIVRYSVDDWRLPVMALKQWTNADKEVFLTLYTPQFVYKYIQGRAEGSQRTTPDPLTNISSIPPQVGIQRRVIPSEPWPLPNPMRIVPVVEFTNKGGSELKKVIPLQDALNYLLISSLGAAGYSALQQRVFMTAAKAPDGGWISSPGRVWHLPPVLDSDGKPMPASMGEFTAAKLGDFREQIEMILQHVALMTKTPVRMFFHSDRGGRGDAPSGESLIVDDEPLLDKVEKRQTRFGNSWMQVVQLVAKAAQVEGVPDPLRGEMGWKDPRAKYRSLLLEEAKNMWEIGIKKEADSRVGIPIEYIVTQIGLPPDDVAVILDSLKKQAAEQKAAEEEALAAEQEMAEAELEIKKTAAENPPAPPAGSRPPQRPASPRS